MEINALITVLLAVVFLLLMLGAYLLLAEQANPINGENSICDGVLSFLKGCR